LQKNSHDWGKLIFKIAILVFIIFFISRWFVNNEENSNDDQGNTGTVQIIEDEGTDLQISEETDADDPGEAEDTGSTTSEKTEVTDISEESDNEAEDTGNTTDIDEETETAGEYLEYEFRNQKLLDKHYDKHGIEMGFASAKEYEAAACAVANNPKALHKLEEEDGDDVYYLEDTGEFVVISTDGFIRTYYYASKSYFDRQ